MTPKNKKTLLICLGILAASYFVHSAVTTTMYAVYQQRMVQSHQDKAGNPLAPNSPATDARLSGNWTGSFASNTLGACWIKMQITESKPNHYIAYPQFTCTGDGLTHDLYKNPANAMGYQLNGESDVISGDVRNDDGSIRFHMDKVVGSDPGGCSLTAFTVTPGGTDTLIAEWQKGSCPAGHTLLRRQKQLM